MISDIDMESFTELLDQAHEILLDRSKEEADLIYAISILDDGARSSTILAYGNIYHKED